MTGAVLIRGARQLLTLRGPSGPRRGEALRDVGLVEDGSVLIVGGVIANVGPTRRIENLAEAKPAVEIDASGRVVMPAFVDSDLYGAGAPGRSLEYPMGDDARIIGRAEIAGATIAYVRSASPARLESEVRSLLSRTARHGTVLLEIKTGFGIPEAAEMKLLRAIRAVHEDYPDMVPAFAACAPPPEFGPDTAAYVDWLCDTLLPRLSARGLAEIVEIACDPAMLSLEDSMRLLRCARHIGLAAKAQVVARSHTGGTRLAVEFEARAVSGLNYCDAADAAMLASSRTIATLLPGPVFHGRHQVYPPARMLIDNGAAVALASGFHPLLPSTLSMQAVVALACAHMGLSAEEAISAATINGAHALQRASSSGSLEFGKNADLLVLDVPDYREIPYHFGMNLVRTTMRRGQIVYGEGMPL